MGHRFLPQHPLKYHSSFKQSFLPKMSGSTPHPRGDEAEPYMAGFLLGFFFFLMVSFYPKYRNTSVTKFTILEHNRDSLMSLSGSFHVR